MIPQGEDYLIIRLSALGDVAMTVPLLYDLAYCYPERKFHLVTQPFMAGLLVDPPANLGSIPFDKSRGRGMSRVASFARKLHEQLPKAIAIDLHNVLRTKLLRSTLAILGHHVVALRKPRKERRKLLQKRSTPQVPRDLYLPRMTDLYLDTLARAGLITCHGGRPVLPHTPAAEQLIGLAPHAQHRAKMISEAQTIELMDALKALLPNSKIILYGAPGAETDANQRLAEQRSDFVQLTSAQGLTAEVREIATLHCMISMDSANQHIAAMVSTPVVSIWGATHPAAGFIPYKTPEERCLGTDIKCRPCSIYGNKPCHRGDHICLQRLDMTATARKVASVIHES